MKETPTSAVSRDPGPAVKLFRQVTPRKLGIKCPPSLRNRVQSTCLDDAAHFGHRRERRRRNHSCSSTTNCRARSATSGGAKKLWSPRCDSPRTGAADGAAGSAPRARISGRPVRTTSRPYYRHQADGSPRSVFFSRCRCTKGLTSCRVSTSVHNKGEVLNRKVCGSRGRERPAESRQSCALSVMVAELQ